MYIVGVTGVMGSGKSMVSRTLEKLGARLLDADQLSRQVLLPGSEGLRQVVARFGPRVLELDGRLNRRKLAELVFTDREHLTRLEEIVHPRIRALQALALAQWDGEDPACVAVLDVPLLFETGWERRCDFTVTVACGDKQEERLTQRPGVNEAIRRMAAARQMAEADKCCRANWVIDNTGTPEETQEQVVTLWEELQKRKTTGTAWPERWQKALDEARKSMAQAGG